MPGRSNFLIVSSEAQNVLMFNNFFLCKIMFSFVFIFFGGKLIYFFSLVHPIAINKMSFSNPNHKDLYFYFLQSFFVVVGLLIGFLIHSESNFYILYMTKDYLNSFLKLSIGSGTIC